jgi:hypothetical protein
VDVTGYRSRPRLKTVNNFIMKFSPLSCSFSLLRLSIFLGIFVTLSVVVVFAILCDVIIFPVKFY